MEQFNKALSFILGLVVVAVFIVVASGKFNIKGLPLPKSKTAVNITPTVTPLITPKPTSKPWFSFLNKPTATPKIVVQVTPKPTSKPWFAFSKAPTSTPKVVKSTPTPKTTAYKQGLPLQQAQVDPNYHSYSGSNIPTSIPNTGVPIVLFPLLGTSLLTGIFMRRTGKKD